MKWDLKNKKNSYSIFIPEEEPANISTMWYAPLDQETISYEEEMRQKNLITESSKPQTWMDRKKEGPQITALVVRKTDVLKKNIVLFLELIQEKCYKMASSFLDLFKRQKSPECEQKATFISYSPKN